MTCPTSKERAAQAAKPAPAAQPTDKPAVTIDDFAKLSLRTAKVLACEAVKKSDKLLKFTLDDGTGAPRTILSGIKAWYDPDTLVGKTVVFIENLEPRRMKGIDSCGMLLSAEDPEGNVKLLTVDGGDIAPGSTVS